MSTHNHTIRHTPMRVRTRTCAVSPHRNVHTFAHAHVHTCTSHCVWRANARMDARAYIRTSICPMQNNALPMQLCTRMCARTCISACRHVCARMCMCARAQKMNMRLRGYHAWMYTDVCMRIYGYAHPHTFMCPHSAYRCVRTYIHVYAYMRMCLLHKQMRARIKTGVYVHVRILWLVTCTRSHAQRRCPCTPTSLWAHKHTCLYVLMHTNVCTSMETRFHYGEESAREQRCMRVCAHVHVQHQQIWAYHAAKKFMHMHTCSYVCADT